MNRLGQRQRIVRLLPLEELTQEHLQVFVNGAEKRKLAEIGLHEFAVGEQLIGERHYVEAEIDRQFKGVLKGQGFRIAQAVITQRIRRNIGFVHHAHDLLIPGALRFQFGRVVRLNGINNQSVIDGDEVAAGAVERVRKPPGFSRQCPPFGTNGLSGIIGKINEAAFINNLAFGEVFGEQRPVPGHPLQHLAPVGNFFGIDHGMVVNQTQARHPMNRNDPEPAAFATEMISRQEVGVTPHLLPLLVQQDFIMGVASKLLRVDLSLNPHPG